MAIAQKTVNYCVEVDTLLGLIVTAVTDIKAGKAPAVIVTDLVPTLVKALGGLSELPKETEAKRELEMTVAVKAAELLQALGV